MRRRLWLFLHTPQWSNRWFHLIVGRSIALPTSQKKGMNQGYSSHRFLQVTTILEQQGLRNPTPMSSPPLLPTRKSHNPTMNPCKQRPAELVPLMESNAPSINMDDADLVRHMVPGMIDDDNQPLPENIPTAIEQQNNTSEFFSSWEHSGSCYRCLEGGWKNNACLSFNSDVQPTIEQLFEMFFQAVHCCNNHPPDKHSVGTTEESPASYGEFLRWLGLWCLMATINGPDRSDFWSMTEVDCFVGAPLRLGGFMSRKRFDMILKALAITSRSPPAFRDHFWEVCEILEAWNANMTEQFTPSWVSCLDESMSTWTNKYSCPGWMFVPRKPWPFGNEYHMVCCSLSGILWQMELMEGKDAPSQLVPKFNNQGKTVGLFLQVLEPILGKGNMVVLDSGFCVLKGIVELKKRGVYASALIKNRSIGPSTSKVMPSRSTLMTKMWAIVIHGRATWTRCPSMCMQ